MTCYSLHGLVFAVSQECQRAGADLADVMERLSFVPVPHRAGTPCFSLIVCQSVGEATLPTTAREVLSADCFRGLESGDNYYLTDGASLFHLQISEGRGTARLTPSFFDRPRHLQRNFWAFGLLKLLRELGVYCLHTAGIVSPQGLGILVAGRSGSGKSTLTIGLVRAGWRYLTDDAALLRLQSDEVEALSFRKETYVDADAERSYRDLPLGDTVPDGSGGFRRTVDIDAIFPGGRVARCVPRVLLFSRVVSRSQSALVPMDRHDALRSLLCGSGPQLFDARTMAPQIEVLRTLVRQAAVYELQAGLDLYSDPLKLVGLLAEAEGRKWSHSG